MPAPRAGAGARRGRCRRRWRGPARGRGSAFNVNQFYQDEGVVALFDRGAEQRHGAPAAAI